MLEKTFSSRACVHPLRDSKKLNEKVTFFPRLGAEGDESSLQTYIPDRGTPLRLVNGDRSVTIEGRDFARLYFEIWFGERTHRRPTEERPLLGE